MTPERIVELTRYVRSLPELGVSPRTAVDICEALLLAKAAIPSGQVAEDAGAALSLLHSCTAEEFSESAISAAVAGVERLAAQAQSAETYRGMWEDAERGRKEALVLAERRRQDRADALNVTTKDGLTASEWVARTGKAERERDEALARCARLSAAGQVLSEHVDKGNDAEQLRAALSEIATICETKELRDLKPSVAVVVQRSILERIHAMALITLNGSTAPSPQCEGEPDCGGHNGGPCKACKVGAMKAEPSQPIVYVPATWTPRDEFAKAAMQGLLSNPGRTGDAGAFARDALKFADAVMQALRPDANHETPQRDNDVSYPERHPHAFEPRDDAPDECGWGHMSGTWCGYPKEDHRP